MLTNFNKELAFKKYDYSKVLTKDMALSDVNYLFRLLKYTYGGYQYFGGDKVFNAAKDNMINKIKNSDSIKVKQFHDLIGQSLDFIKDGHFRITNSAPIDKYKNIYYYSEEYEFYKDEKGYYTSIDNTKYYLKSVESSNKVQEYMKLTINKDGKLVHNIGLLQNNIEPILKLNIKLINDKKQLDKKVSLVESMPLGWYNNKTGFSKQIINGIPVVTCTRMYDKNNTDNSYKLFDESCTDNTCKLFGESGKELKNYPISVVDIRSNQGGFEEPGAEWFEGYTGQPASPSNENALLYSKVYSTVQMKLEEEIKKNEKNMSDDDYVSILTDRDRLSDIIKNKGFNKWVTWSQPGILVDNKNIVLVLIDNEVGSAGELYVEKLRTLKNVIFVGTNTNGCALIGGDFPYKLPNSGEVLFFGAGLILKPNFEEGTGYMPDIWVNGKDALTRVEKLIGNNKIKN